MQTRSGATTGAATPHTGTAEGAAAAGATNDPISIAKGERRTKSGAAGDDEPAHAAA